MGSRSIMFLAFRSRLLSNSFNHKTRILSVLFHADPLLNRKQQYVGKPGTSVLKSSRPLNEGNDTESVAKKPKKPRRYVVFGDVTVDEETFAKMEAEAEGEIDDIDEEDLQNIVQNSEHFYNMHKTEEKLQRKVKRNITLERKLFPQPVEPCLLTWEAKRQIQYLHKLDPDEWTAEEVVKHFPISELGAKKLIRSTFRSASEEKIKRHDSSVQRTWQRIQKGELDNLHPTLQERWLNKQLKIEQSLPNPALPLPPPRNPNTSPLLLGNPERPVGEFLALVKPYIDIKKKTEDKKNQDSSSSVTNVSDSRPVFSSNSAKDSRDHDDWVSVATSHTLGDEVDEDEEQRRREMRRKHHMTHEQLTEQMKEGLRKKRNKTNEDEQMLAWLENQRPAETPKYIESNLSRVEKNNDEDDSYLWSLDVPKYKDQQVQFSYGTPKHAGHPDRAEAYVYDSGTGYQHPLGKNDDIPQWIRIDRNMKKENGLYKVGDCFYSDEGEFIFRVFT